MTMLDQVAPRSGRSYAVFRLTTLLFAVLLGAQCSWLLLTELSRTGIDRLPTSLASASAASTKKQRDKADWAALIGGIRGELWAESAFTYADLLFSENAKSLDADGNLARARTRLNHALDDAPHQSGAWLLLAGLAVRYPSPGYDASGALKMSYYTGASEQNLMPLRLSIAARSSTFSDVEIRQFVSRDIRLLLGRKQKIEIAEAYDGASLAGRNFIEYAIEDIDPSALASLRKNAQKQLLPD